MNSLAPLARYLGTQQWMMKVEPLIPYFERFLAWLTGGRVSVLRLAGLPGLRLTVLGRKSGQPRTTNLLCAPYGDGFIVNGSNWGKPKHPVWTTNLAATDTAEVEYRGQSLAVAVRQVDGAERERLWARLLEVWPGYRMEHEMSGRDSRVFLLAPAPGQRLGALVTPGRPSWLRSAALVALVLAVTWLTLSSRRADRPSRSAPGRARCVPAPWSRVRGRSRRGRRGCRSRR